MKNKTLIIAFLFLASVVGQSGLAQEQSEDAAPQYLYIEQFAVAPGRVINDTVDEFKDWVKVMRKTGDFNSVRLFLHHTGPESAVYILAEPKDWQSIESGIDAPIEELGLMDKPTTWSGHSDNILSEIPVE